jgi:hypothetical protein
MPAMLSMESRSMVVFRALEARRGRRSCRPPSSGGLWLLALRIGLRFSSSSRIVWRGSPLVPLLVGRSRITHIACFVFSQTQSVLARLGQLGAAEKAIRLFDAAPSAQHHRVSIEFLGTDAPSFRQCVEQLNAGGDQGQLPGRSRHQTTLNCYLHFPPTDDQRLDPLSVSVADNLPSAGDVQESLHVRCTAWHRQHTCF